MSEHTPEHDPDHHDADAEDALVQEARLWQGNGWTAKVIKNDDDEGWAVAMIKDGEPEPALVGPWTMGRDKKNPKPLDAPRMRAQPLSWGVCAMGYSARPCAAQPGLWGRSTPP